MRFLYDTFFILFGIVCLPYLLLKKKLHREFFQRFGILPNDLAGEGKPVWIHAVSVGEAVLALRVAKAVKERFPGTRVVVSATTQTGMGVVRSALGGSVDAAFYSPLDLSFVSERVARIVDPFLYIMIETELWPNLIRALNARYVPVALVNGRISDGSFRNYKRIVPIIRKVLSQIDIYCMQSEKDAMKIRELGAFPDIVRVTGSMKFDVELRSEVDAGLLKDKLGFDRTDPVIVAGSTHFPEEKEMIDIYGRLRERHTGLRLVIAPRHVERSDAIGIYLHESGLKYLKFSDIEKGSQDADKTQPDVVMVDTIGHLKYIYAAATIIFTGGSLVNKGGQNPIEGACLGKPVIFGPHMSNFREIEEILLEQGAASKVKDAGALYQVFDELLSDKKRCDDMGKNAYRVVRDNAGAMNKTLDELADLFE